MILKIVVGIYVNCIMYVALFSKRIRSALFANKIMNFHVIYNTSVKKESKTRILEQLHKVTRFLQLDYKNYSKSNCSLR